MVALSPPVSQPREDTEVPDLEHYTGLEVVWAAVPSIVTYRGISRLSGQQFIIKFASGRDEGVILQLRHEFRTLNFLRSQQVYGVSEPLCWNDYSNGSVIVMAYGGQTFRELYLSRPVQERGPVDYLKVMLHLRSITSTLQSAHALNCRHNNLRTDVLCGFVDRPGDVTVTSWLFSSRLAVEMPFSQADVLNTSLPYVAPECTGRMNSRTVDSRADLYSLGVTFYEIITGQVPFNETSSLGLMHSHLANTVIPLSKFGELDVPPMIDALIMKLLQKNPDDRYQTAAGVLVDVEHIIEALENGNNSATISIGREDLVSRFVIAPDFVARERELGQLTELFNQVQQTSTTRVATVAGYSGIGKSRLVKEVMLVLSQNTQNAPFYAESKYDQFKAFAPFSTFSAVFSDLLAQIFVETASNLKSWRTKVLRVLGDEARALCELCPDLIILLTESYVKGLPPVIPLTGLAAEERFRRGIKKLMQAFATKLKPLVLFIDDIQWAPLIDLQLLCELRLQNHLVLLTAYRDNEVDSGHIVNTVFMAQAQPDLKLTLGALPLSGTRQLVCNTLHRPLQASNDDHSQPEVNQLVQVIHAKTSGNAFHIGQVLQSLHASGLLRYDFHSAAWTWDIQAVRMIDTSDDVVALVLKQVNELSPQCREILSVASCLGNSSFRLDILTTIVKHSHSLVASSLFQAMSAGLVIANDEKYKAAIAGAEEWPREFADDLVEGAFGAVSYRFLHDRVQQACFALVDEADRPALHARIGLALLETFSQDDSMIFDICSQINLASEFVPEYLRMDIARLNIRAARIAFSNTANGSAHALLTAAAKFFPTDVWSTAGSFALDYYLLLEEVSSSLALYDAAKNAAETVLQHASDNIIKVKIHGRLMKAELSAGRTRESLWFGIEGLRYAGLDLRGYFADGADELVLSATADLWAALPSSPESIAALRQMPAMTNALTYAALDLILELLPSVFFVRPSCVGIVTLTAIKISQEAGQNSFGSAYFYGFASLLLAEVSSPIRDYEKSRHYSTLANAVLQDLLRQATGTPASVPSAMVIIGAAAAWVEDARTESAKIFEQAEAESLRTYNHEYQAYACGNKTSYILFAGAQLNGISQASLSQLEAIESYRRAVGYLYVRPVLQTVENLRTSTNLDDILELSGTISTPADIKAMRELSLPLHLATYYGCALLVHVLFASADSERGLRLVGEAALVAPGAQGLVTKLNLCIYSLIVLIDADAAMDLTEEQQNLKATLTEYANVWSEECAAIFGFWKPFFKAETGKSTATVETTLQLFNAAIDKAQEMSNGLLIALYNERCALYLRSLNTSFDRAARGYALDAADAYKQWGCEFKGSRVMKDFSLARLAPAVLPTKFKDPSKEDVYSMSSSTDTLSADGLIAALPGKAPLQTFPFKHPATRRLSKSRSSPRRKELDPVDEASAELDLESVLRNALVLSTSENLEEAIPHMLNHLLQTSGAQNAALIVAGKEDGQFSVSVSGALNNFKVHENVSIDDDQNYAPARLIRLAANSRKAVIDDAKILELDRLKRSLPKSFMALPVILQDKVTAVLYLSNSQITNLFSSRKVELLTIMATQAAITIEKTQLLNALEEANRELSKSKAAVVDHATHLESVVEERTKQLEIQNAQLVMAKDMAEQATLMKTRFLSNMSHEIRTPFNSVVGFSTLLLETKLDSEQKDMAQSIIDASSDLLVIINDVLDLAKVEEGKMKLSPVWFDFRTMMESALEMIARNAALKGIDIAYLESDDDFEIGQVFADNTRMRQCVLNLLSNAVKFCPENNGGLVKATSRIEFIGKPDEEGDQKVKIIVDVEDRGIGIAEADMSKLFGFFSQVDDSTTRQYGGSGLGLAISRRMCRLFDGDLTVVSEVGKGSTFSASFCATINHRTHPTESPRCEAFAKKTCLILEPSDLTQEAIRQHLTKFGVKWFSQRTLEEVAAATEQADFCVIGDSFNQPETIKALRKRWVNVERLPLVVMMPFGATLPKQLNKQDEDVIDAVVSTPVRRGRLLKSIQSLYPEQGNGLAKSAKSTQPNIVKSPNHASSMKLLLVEDNLVNVKVATQLLKKLGYVPKVAYDGLQAVQACAVEDFDLIFMDLQMPVLSGLAATQEIRAAQTDDKAPFICAMTANAMAGDEQRCIEAGMDHYISKPVMLPKLRAVIDLMETRYKAASAGAKEDSQQDTNLPTDLDLGTRRMRQASVAEMLGQMKITGGLEST
ncbi:hypothetical protein BCR37DRAFT_412302 [Protomyces lactucae-debilis]|uniref:Histidine kinase n=1 Tax=Protomyces lactucae-debilis TaxID=2754530 RepID=A0A1Y2FNP0_PROLT|nr:uncharacterized protein BCR37DRAFT_412302 [Protomyces lactucae-debilis]ORY85588.1 hypothetical protein BCR37DRAFT_412302 [Protomyces lactucae-debilis]